MEIEKKKKERVLLNETIFNANTTSPIALSFLNEFFFFLMLHEFTTVGRFASDLPISTSSRRNNGSSIRKNNGGS